MLRIYLVNTMNYFGIFIRILVVYVILIIALRILGKREVGELSLFDLVILLIIADIASIGIDNPDFAFGSYFCVACLVLFQRIISIILIRYAKLRSVMDGSSRIIVLDGKLSIKNMKKERYTIDDLIAQMRLEHIMDIDEIKLAILETNGTLSIFRNSQFETIKLPIITSGIIQEEPLIVFGISKNEFINLLSRIGINYKKVLYCSISKESLCFYFSSKKDKELTCHKVSWKELT